MASRFLSRLLVCATAAMMAIPAFAEADVNNRAAWNPPAQYDIPYAGKLIEFPLQQQAVRRHCKELNAQLGFNFPDSPHKRGCAFRLDGGKTCVIVYIDHQYGLSTPEAVRRHELGHCNGWPSNHLD